MIHSAKYGPTLVVAIRLQKWNAILIATALDDMRVSRLRSYPLAFGSWQRKVAGRVAAFGEKS